ncbi:MAG: T9SS type A sorting domain-containing protein [Bacteroidales bacterium]|nr:T9SS type A sorting domain-containing protein [Bacteroidales bacterium]
MKKYLLFVLLLGMMGVMFAQDRADSIHVHHYDIVLNITDFDTKIIYGHTDLQVVSKVDDLQYVDLDLQRLEVDSLWVNNQLVSNFTHEGTLLHIPLSQSLQQHDTVQLCVFYSGRPATDSYFGGFYYSGEYCYNLGVAFRDLPHVFGRAWYPCLDFFTDKATYTFTIETEEGKRAICGGELVDSIATDTNTTIWRWELNDPVPTYLTSIAVGNYMHYADTVQGLTRVIPIDIYTRPSEFDRIAGNFAHLKDALHIFESRFGPYPWCRIGYVGVAFTGGAMEHVTNIAYPQLAITGNSDNESLYIHEFSHMWFGDLVTCLRAEEMWLNEGFARYSEALAEEVLYPSDNPLTDGYKKNIRDLHAKVLRNAHIDDEGYWALDSMPQAVTYGTTTYDKGALVIHTLRKYMGDSAFFAAIPDLLSTFAYQNISTLQLFDFLSAHCGTNLHAFREAWVSQPGFLHFSIDSICPTATPGEYKFFVRQRLSHARHFGQNNLLDITFFSSDNQRYTLRDFQFSGEFAEGTVQLPWVPVVALVDLDEEMGDAIIDYNFEVTSSGLKTATNANVRVLVNVCTDTAFLYVADNLVAPDTLRGENSHLLGISNQHYWSIVVPGDVLEGSMRFDIKAGSENDPDYEFLYGHTMNELVMLYRRNPGDVWMPLGTTKTGTLANGHLAVDGIRTGEYAIGIGDGTVGIDLAESEQTLFAVYPNPASDNLIVENVQSLNNQTLRCFIMDMNGRQVMSKMTLSNYNNLNISNLKSGIYLLSVESDGEVIYSTKFIKQ